MIDRGVHEDRCNNQQQSQKCQLDTAINRTAGLLFRYVGFDLGPGGNHSSSLVSSISQALPRRDSVERIEIRYFLHSLTAAEDRSCELYIIYVDGARRPCSGTL